MSSNEQKMKTYLKVTPPRFIGQFESLQIIEDIKKDIKYCKEMEIEGVRYFELKEVKK